MLKGMSYMYTTGFKLKQLSLANSSGNGSAGTELRVSEKLVRHRRKIMTELTKLPRATRLQRPELENKLQKRVL